MKPTAIVLKTYPDLIQQHKLLAVDYFEVPIRPIIFGKKASLDEQLTAFSGVKEKVIGIHGSIYRESVNLLDPAAH